MFEKDIHLFQAELWNIHIMPMTQTCLFSFFINSKILMNDNYFNQY